MDGTLLNSSSKVSRENKAALERFVKGGGLFTVATGRMEKSVVQYLADLPINVPAIVYNGAAIYDYKTERMLWQDNLTPSTIEPVRQVMERYPDIGIQFYHGGRAYIVRQNEYTRAHMIRENFKPIIAELDEIPLPWFKIILAWDPKKLHEVEEFLKGFDEPFRQVYSEPQFLELLNVSTSKGNALKVLTRRLGLSQSCVIAMGDNLNDMELIKEADIGIAVENAHTMLKSAADICCAHHDRNAVSEVIDWIEDGIIVC
jgi:Cof subfamily protein (haloacid dehalogenase superfamily)